MNTDDHKRMVALLNETGTPFQDLCMQVVHEVGSYRVFPERPYTWPISNGPLLGNPGSIDFIATSISQALPRALYGICLVVECKRASSSIKNWVFPEVDKRHRYRPWFLLGEFNLEAQEKAHEINYLLRDLIQFPNLGYYQNYELVTQGFEFNKDNTSINRQQNEKIYNSLKQVNTGLRALTARPLEEELLHVLKPNKKAIFIPVVVTTANLFCAQLDPGKVNIAEGEIDPADVLLSPKEWVTFSFPTPDYMSFAKSIERMPTFVVNANSWSKFLKNVQDVKVPTG